MITLSLDPDIEELTAGLNRLSRKVQTAIKRAVRKLILWLRRQMLQQASRISGVPQKEIIRHRRIYLDEHVSASRESPNGVGSGSGDRFSRDSYFQIPECMEGTARFGASPLPLHLAGRVSWTPSSASTTVAGRQYAGVSGRIENIRARFSG